MEQRAYSLADLLRVMQRLRDPRDGCPWDLAQDFGSIVPSTLEECYELVHAIEQADYPHVREELGDVLFQVVFYAQLGSEQGYFSFPDIVDTLVRKLLRRHPHVFAQGDIEGRVEGASCSEEEVKRSWEAIKQTEREAKAQGGLLDDVPEALPALSRAQKLQKRAARANFDWGETGPVLDKLAEEVGELREALAGADQAQVRGEMGDLLFSCVNLCRHLGLDAETTLRGASAKFERRFRGMEQLASSRGQTLENLDEWQLDRLWRQVKARE